MLDTKRRTIKLKRKLMPILLFDTLTSVKIYSKISREQVVYVEMLTARVSSFYLSII